MTDRAIGNLIERSSVRALEALPARHDGTVSLYNIGTTFLY